MSTRTTKLTDISPKLAPEKRIAQRRLAAEVTELVHKRMFCLVLIDRTRISLSRLVHSRRIVFIISIFRFRRRWGSPRGNPYKDVFRVRS